MRGNRRLAGLALIVVVGVLGVLSVLAVTFVTMAQLERKAATQRVYACRAHLLSRSGVEDALARLALGQDPAYGGEDFDGDGLLSAGVETSSQVYQPGTLNVMDCPVKQALRPSFFVSDHSGPGSLPALTGVDGRLRGYSGRLAGDSAIQGNTYALKAEDLNARIYINGGMLDGGIRPDPDGPASLPEAGQLSADAVQGHNDASMEGPNGFLVRLLNNLDSVLTVNATSDLGVKIIRARPVGGYRTVSDLKAVLGPSRYDQVKEHLTVSAWVDPKVVRPQPMDGRPFRWQDIDDAHRIGTQATEISGVRTSGGGNLQLNAGISGNGKELNVSTGDAPWSQNITATNDYEGARTYPVSWERNFVYAWSQLRLAPPAQEPRAPVSINTASSEVLASVFLGLKGTYLETWDANAGWDAGFGWQNVSGTRNITTIVQTYPFDQTAEDTPWHRTRADYGCTTGSGVRPWYNPANYDPHASPRHGGGKPVIQAEPLGRLKETAPISRDQALALAAQIRQRVSQKGPFRTWMDFNAFVDQLPTWEDVNNDGFLDGMPYAVSGTEEVLVSSSFYNPVDNTTTATTNVSINAATYNRRMYKREDANSDGVMNRQVFGTVSSAGAVSWVDWPKTWHGSAWTGADPPSWDGANVPGLTVFQKAVVKAMANPNTDLNDFNPDGNLWKDVDKTDLCGVGSQKVSSVYQADSDAYVHTTELALDSCGRYRVESLGRVLAGDGRLLAARTGAATVSVNEIYRDTTQADFMRAYRPGNQPLSNVFSGAASNYPLSGGQPLISYPEPQTVAGGARAADAAYDGQVGLGFYDVLAGPTDLLRGSLFDTTDAPGVKSGDYAVMDVHGPFLNPLVGAAGSDIGNVFPDGVYSEKDRTLRYPMQSTKPPYAAAWVKVNWFPEASPRPHALFSISPHHMQPGYQGFTCGDYNIPVDRCPLDDIYMVPAGLYFEPGRNNSRQDVPPVYAHNASSTRGSGWPSRSLIWGAPHGFWASDTLNLRGILNSGAPGNWDGLSNPLPAKAHPIGRLEAHRWQYCSMTGIAGNVTLYLGKKPASFNGGGWTLVGIDNIANLSHYVALSDGGAPNHVRFGEMAGLNNMNYVADATFANVAVGTSDGGPSPPIATLTTPAQLGRYYKEDGAAFTSAKLPAGIRPLRATWTEVPCDLWFDLLTNGTNSPPEDGWMDTLASDQFGAGGSSGPNGKRDVRIDLEIWDDNGKLAALSDPADPNAISTPTGQLYYKAVFVNEWDAAARANVPLDVTPYLDDVTITYMNPYGPRVLSWEEISE